MSKMPSRSLQHEQTQDRQERPSTRNPQRGCLHLTSEACDDLELLTAVDGSNDTVYFFPTLLDDVRQRSDTLSAEMESYLGIYMSPIVQRLAYIAISGLAISGAVVAKSKAIGLPVEHAQLLAATSTNNSRSEDGVQIRSTDSIMSSGPLSGSESLAVKQREEEERRRHIKEADHAKKAVSTHVARIKVLEQQLLEAEALITRATEKLTSQDDELDKINKHLKKVNRRQVEEEERTKDKSDANLMQLQNAQRDLHESSMKRKELESLIADLKRQTEAREGNLISANEEVMRLKELVRSLHGTIDNHKRKLDSSENSTKDLQADLSHLVQELNTLKTKHTQDGDDIRAHFEEQIAELSLKLSNAESAKTALANQFDELQSMSQRKLHEETKLKDEALFKLKSEMNVLKESIMADMAQAEKYISDLKTEHAEVLGERTTELETTGKLVSAHADTITNLKIQYANTMEEKANELENTKTLHNSEILDLEDSHAAELEYMKQAITTAQRDAKKLRADYDGITQKNQMVESESSVHLQRVEALTREVESLNALQKQWNTERDALEERNRTSHERLHNQVKESQNRYNLLDEERVALMANLEQVQAKYKEHQGSYNRLVEQTSESKAKLEDTLTSQVRAHRTETDALKHNNEAISNELSKSRDQAEASLRDLSIASAREIDLTSQLKQMEDKSVANDLIAVETAKQFDSVRGELRQHKESLLLRVKEQETMKIQYEEQAKQLRQTLASAAEGEKNFEALKIEKNSLEERIVTLLENVHQNNVLLETSRTELSAVVEEKSKLQGLYEAKSKESSVARTNLTENSAKLDNLIAQLKGAIHLHANEISDLTKKHNQALASSENKAKDQQAVISKLLLDKAQLTVEHEKTANLIKAELQATKTSLEQSVVLADDRLFSAQLQDPGQGQIQFEVPAHTSPLVVNRRVSISSQTSAAPQASDLDDIFSALDRTNIRAGSSSLKEQRVERNSPLRTRSDAFDTLVSTGEMPVSSPTPSTNEEFNGLGKTGNRLTGLLRRSTSKQFLSRKGSVQNMNVPGGP